MGTLLSKSAEVKSFKQKVEKEKLETKWLDGSRVFVEDDNPVGSAVVFAKCISILRFFFFFNSHFGITVYFFENNR